MQFDVLIIGSGAAGLALALSLAEKAQVALVSKTNLMAGSSQRAQGGIAAVMSQTDSYESHIQDTLAAGAGLCDPTVVRYVVTHAKEAIHWLIQQGVQFSTSEKSELHLTQEGGHSHRRIVHVADRTGAAVVNTLAEQAMRHPNITCLTELTAIDLLMDPDLQRCVGATFLNNEQQAITTIHAQATVLATGGASMVYLHTSNPDHTSGDGIAMAWRAGCVLANLEFNQFHPTCLYHPQAKSYLISEVVRGEGGKLILPNGERFMDRYDPRGELAPRDIVARAIDSQMKQHNIDCVFLDITHLAKTTIKKLFPTIHNQCLRFGIDISEQPIPVVPAAHYTCGGVLTDLNGKTNVDRLYAIGEVACTGLHGANRMASNSLLECLVLAKNADLHIMEQLSQKSFASTSTIQTPSSIQSNHTNADITSIVKQIRQTMWQHVGIVRNNQSLAHAHFQLQTLLKHVEQLWENDPPTKTIIELRNLAQVAALITQCARLRQESRGLHFNTDYPTLAAVAKNMIISRTQTNLMTEKTGA